MHCIVLNRPRNTLAPNLSWHISVAALYKWLIEVIDVSMCYSCQRQLKPGERMWVYRKELFRDEGEHKPKCRKKQHTSFDDEDLPF